eukprot:3880243-Prymnesium_polylepis.1
MCALRCCHLRRADCHARRGNAVRPGDQHGGVSVSKVGCQSRMLLRTGVAIGVASTRRVCGGIAMGSRGICSNPP